AALHGQRGVAPEGDADLAALSVLHAGIGFGRAGALVVEESAEPAVPDAAGVGGLPDVHGREVRAVGVGVPDALHDREQAGVVQFLHPGHGRVQANGVVRAEPEDIALGYRDAGAGPVVVRVAEGDDGVEPVVAAAELD